jgi:hypothetical protein
VFLRILDEILWSEFIITGLPLLKTVTVSMPSAVRMTQVVPLENVDIVL